MVSFEFPTTVRKVIRNPNMFVKLDLLIVRGLNSKHSVALYELMKDYQGVGKKRCEIEEFRKLMGIKPDQYSIFTMLKQRVLDVAVNEINEKTDIRVEYSLENLGRKVNALLLKVSPKDEKMEEHNAGQSIKEKLHAFGLNDKKIEGLLKKHDEQYLWANIGIVEEQLKKGKITNTTGYLLKSFENDFRPLETEYDQSRRQESAEKESEDQARKEREEHHQYLLQAFEQRKQERINARAALLSQDELDHLKEEFIQNTLSNEIFKRLYQTKGFDNPVVQIQWNKFLAPVLLTEEELDFSNFQATADQNNTLKTAYSSQKKYTENHSPFRMAYL